MEEREKTEVEASIHIIMKAAIIKIFSADPCCEEVLEQLEQTAEKICKTFGLKGKIMDEYRSKVMSAKEIQMITSELYPVEVERVRDVIYEMCDQLDDPKEIMKYIRTTGKIMDIWNPEK